MTCPHCLDAPDVFDNRTARRDLRRLLKRGPRASTRLLLDGIEARLTTSFSLLDIGSGVGAIPAALMDRLASGTVVDASAGYLRIAESHAASMGFAERMTYREGDFVQLADDVPVHDVVTLDRVLCCYPDLAALVRSSAARAEILYAVVFPRVHALTRISFPLMNAFLALRRSAFRVFLHPARSVIEQVAAAGLRPLSVHNTLLWQVHIFERV